MFLKVIDKLVGIATGCVILVAAATVIPQALGYPGYYVKSGSMEPAIQVGALMYADTHDTELEIGDIGIFKMAENIHGSNLVTHRVVGISEDGTYITKGDANDTVDVITRPQESVVGTYLFSIPKLGLIYAGITDRVRTVLVGLVLGFNCLNLFLQNFFGKEEAEEENDRNQNIPQNE